MRKRELAQQNIMETSLFLGQLFGIYLVIEGLMLVFRARFLHRVIADFVKTPALRYFAGILVVIMGLLLVLTHNIWEYSWIGLITFISWLILIKGILYLFMDERSVHKMVAGFNNKSSFTILGIIVFILGVWLVRIGFGWM
ncbi:MAG: hypothetical protein COV10_02590 [Candidatus Vogelbacteria bacterium CG10_big_fil_rev_8_21_14_0_10_51_16]|uniref:Integral membrane protein (PIN domain superfamily) n=1 Tax=Candidatus Vogelbacteria bacterium CG10_big_fil_rev_8_21_14_0_10_51_16 TaxID=1975045 RepID=A0A2H0RE03_9BACT|nr:MAG: hypothetical protein COV10_02590 [Candidatus Vogelbacteria bacterium CG10_big_fil_rev_8_21_14_0_10_51_16]